ncbi:MAG: hypothetical protein WA723_07160, partial [Pseudolabrys sp.]
HFIKDVAPSRETAPRLSPQSKASLVLWHFANSLSSAVSLKEHRRILLFSRTWYPHGHNYRAASLAAMNDVMFFCSSLHRHEADRA